MKRLPASVHSNVKQAFDVLVSIGMPPAQQNERTALTLLALAGVGPKDNWTAVTGRVRLGISEIMGWMGVSYGKKYKENSRETVRRFSIHQLVSAGLVQQNVDGALAINSQDNRYCLTPECAALLRDYSTPRWAAAMASFLVRHKALVDHYAKERLLSRVPVKIRTSTGVVDVHLSAGGQNPLVKAVIEGFAAYFTPGALVAYIGDTGAKHAHHDRATLASIGIVTDSHGKMPDLILVYEKAAGVRWLVIVEAVTSHGPMNQKRVDELNALFADCSLGKVFVTAFPNRATMVKFAKDVAWETEVWIADNPTHLIHYNGDRFLGPHGPNPKP